MAQVQCEYCGSYIEDTEPNCPNCGAVNSCYVRTASDTPRTIEELKEWYCARNLPPENVTRFFIGRNVHEKRAFGIYQDGKDFIVYKNKDDGSRAVRYKGRDQAYAVNEIYMRLKQEIMNQKNLNSAKARSAPARSTPGTSQMNGSFSAGRSARHGCLMKLLVAFGIMLGFIGCGAIGVAIDNKTPENGTYYMGDGTPLFYYYGETSDVPDGGKPYEWWVSEDCTGSDWQIYDYYKEAQFPDGINRKSKLENIDGHPEIVPVWQCENYIDAHHGEPDEGYYLLDGNAYYYLHDEYGRDYGRYDASGWYCFNDGWDPVCTFNRKESVPHGLWYYPEDYRIGLQYECLAASDAALSTRISSFSETQYKIDAVQAYKNYVDANHKKPSEGYYYTSNNRIYYYLNDPYGRNYGKGDQSGWYTYGDDGWEYYCDYEDYDRLDDDLWYYPDERRVGYSYNDFYSFSDAEGWNATDFSDTTWYQDAEDAYDSWYDYNNSSSSDSSYSSSSSWDNDSSYDWDSGSSWDSGGSDWGSDW